MPQLSMSFNVSDETMQRILDLVIQGQRGQDEQPTFADGIDQGRVRSFVQSLNDSCRAAVASVAAHSRTPGSPVSRTQLAQESGLTDTQFNGVIGTIGRRWVEAFPQAANPFVGRRIAPHADEWFYVIHPDLAEQLLAELEADANRWRRGITNDAPAS